jgi:hypothetical protein
VVGAYAPPAGGATAQPPATAATQSGAPPATGVAPTGMAPTQQGVAPLPGTQVSAAPTGAVASKRRPVAALAGGAVVLVAALGLGGWYFISGSAAAAPEQVLAGPPTAEVDQAPETTTPPIVDAGSARQEREPAREVTVPERPAERTVAAPPPVEPTPERSTSTSATVAGARPVSLTLAPGGAREVLFRQFRLTEAVDRPELLRAARDTTAAVWVHAGISRADSAMAAFIIGETFRVLGDNRGAIEWLSRAVALDPSKTAWKNVLDALRSGS